MFTSVLTGFGTALSLFEFIPRCKQWGNSNLNTLNFTSKEVVTMPKSDGTGPKGKGPMTGRKQGSCNPAGKTLKPQGRGGWKSGKGTGKGRGAGQDRGRR
jgi:hypothetical protein